MAAKWFQAVCKLGLEGIVSKKLGAPYKSGPSKAWLKIKNPKARRIADIRRDVLGSPRLASRVKDKTSRRFGVATRAAPVFRFTTLSDKSGAP
jgi:hypothetical protein